MNEILILLIPKVRLFELNCIGDVIIDNPLYCLKYFEGAVKTTTHRFEMHLFTCY